MMDHPCIIRYVESFEDNRYMYIVQELIDECLSLEEVCENALVQKKSPLMTVSDVRKLMKMIMAGMVHIHENDIVHRDIKPANVIIDDAFRIRIIDFGLANYSPKQLTGGDADYFGTPMFMAPEVLLSKGALTSYGKPVDVYACGVMFHYFLSGTYSLDREKAMTIKELEEMICRGQVVKFEGDVWS